MSRQIVSTAKMGYGAISGAAIATRVPQRNVATVHPTSRVVQMQTSRAILSESSPLIVRRRRRRSPESEGLFNWRVCCLVLILVFGVLIGIHLLVIEYNELPTNYPFHLINWSYWYFGEPFESLNFTALNSSSVSNVVIFHTRGELCFNFTACCSVISAMQTQNSTNNPFNFLIGGDGKTYEWRGWNYKSGFDMIPFNSESLAVGLIGDFTFFEPPTNQVQEVEALISESIRRRKLLSTYKIHGARLHTKDGHKMFSKFKSLAEWAGWI